MHCLRHPEVPARYRGAQHGKAIKARGPRSSRPSPRKRRSCSSSRPFSPAEIHWPPPNWN